jgi:lysozyme
MPYDDIFDISNWQGLPKMGAAKAAGFDAVIIKATEGTGSIDPSFAHNWAEAGSQKLLRGAYHFSEGGSGVAQADFILDTVKPDAKTLVALDFERNPNGASMTIDEAVAFVSHVHDELGRWPVLYGGDKLKTALNQQANATLSNCPLWLAQYGPNADLPPGWASWTLWQFSNGTINKPASPVPGVGACDRDRYIGDRAALAANWPL